MGNNFDYSSMITNLLGLGATSFLGPAGAAIVGPLSLGLQKSGLFGGQSGTDQAFGKDFGGMQKLRDESAYNLAGAKGLAASRQAAEKTNQYVGKSSAEGASAFNALQNIAGSQLAAPQNILDAATANAQRELGNQRRSFMESANASGAPLAARIAALSGLGQASGQTLSNLYTQGLQGTQQALAGAAGTIGAGNELRMKDLQTQLSMAEPYLMRLDPAMTASQLGAMGQYRQQALETADYEDPWAPSKKLIGQGAAMGFMDPWQQLAYKRQAAAQRGEDPSKISFGIFG